ncbi:hypothetical protein ABT160_09315 [Streptomyces sp. NPDC001941]|uniref:terpene synthase family protein n=1 Tax=Streptomyces sp. NPDC001941 TaxID=3154659 RepID=UPI003320DED1
MPQDVPIPLPFTPVTGQSAHTAGSSSGPDAGAARARSLAWCERHRLVNDPVAAERFTDWDIAGLMAAWIPGAAGERLDLAVDAVAVAAFLDEQFDGPAGARPERVEAVCAAFRAVTAGHRAAPGAPPLVVAFADVWRRLCAGASAPWVRAAARHWHGFLEAYAEEARGRVRRREPGRAEHFALRRRSGFVFAMLDLSQKAYGFELPPDAHRDPLLARMADITADVVDALNAVYSLEKEEARGDRHNLVLALEGRGGGSRDECLARVRELVLHWCEEFLTLETMLLEGEHARTGRDAEVPARFTEAMRCAMSGYLAWGRDCRRYAVPVPAGGPVPLADLVGAR